MARVYLETSFASAMVTDRADPGSLFRKDRSIAWWNLQARRHQLIVSVEVLAELSDPEFRRGPDAIAMIQDVDVVEITDEVLHVAVVLVAEYVMPGPVAGDAIHVAAAAVSGADYLLSWNVRHLANPNKIRHLTVVCRRLALTPPQIVTPDSLWESP